MDPIVLGIGSFVILILMAGAVWFVISNSSGASPEVDDSVVPAARAISTDLEKAQENVTSAMNEVSGNITTLIGNVHKYDAALDQHRRGIEDAGKPTDVKAVEENLLAELDKMRALNERYRKQLASARETIRHQQDEIENARHEAGEDGLTRIPNRRSFDKRLAEEISRIHREVEPLALLLIDIDHFKDVNDNYGHVIGDSVLQGVALVLNDLRRQHDFLARYGGEEFCMILPKTSLDHAVPVSERIREKIQYSCFKKDGNDIKVTVSIGIAEFRPSTDNEDLFIARCDEALYRAKSGGRNRVECERPQDVSSKV